MTKGRQEWLKHIQQLKQEQREVVRSLEAAKERTTKAVIQARSEYNNISWTDIGQALGITRQAAWDQFKDVVSSDIEGGGSRARFDDNGRQEWLKHIQQLKQEQREVVRSLEAANERTTIAVIQARSENNNISWTDIGRALEITRQGASDQFKDVVPQPSAAAHVL